MANEIFWSAKELADVLGFTPTDPHEDPTYQVYEAITSYRALKGKSLRDLINASNVWRSFEAPPEQFLPIYRQAGRTLSVWIAALKDVKERL